MADNVTVGNTSSQANDYVVASDDDGTAQHQYVKVEFGDDNTQTKVTSAVGLPVSDAGGSLTVDGTVTANLSATDNAVLDSIQAAVEAIQTAVEVLDNVVSGSEAQVDVLTVPAPLSTTGGGTEATALRVTVASDSTGVLTVDNAGTFAVQDSTVAGHLDTVETVLGTIDTDTGNIATSAALLDNAVYVDDADFTDGTSSGYGMMAVAEGTPTTVTDGDMGMVGMTTDKRALKTSVVDALPAGTNAIGKLAANSGVDIGDVDVTSSALPTGASTSANQTTIIGHVDGIEGLLTTIDADTGNIDTKLGTIDNAVYVDDADFTADTSSGYGIMAVSEAAATSNTDGDMGMLSMTTARALRVQTEGGSETAASPVATDTGGATTFYSADLDETEEEVKATGGTVYGWIITNRTAAPVYIHFYNATTANVTVGTTGAQFVFAVPGNASDYIAANVLGGIGINFSTAITVAATTDFPDDGSPAGPAANGVICTVFYA